MSNRLSRSGSRVRASLTASNAVDVSTMRAKTKNGG